MCKTQHQMFRMHSANLAAFEFASQAMFDTVSAAPLRRLWDEQKHKKYLA